MILAYISIEGWIVHPDVNSLFYGSDEVLVLSPHNAEILNGGIMICDVLVVQLKICYQTEREPSLSIYMRSTVRKV